MIKGAGYLGERIWKTEIEDYQNNCPQNIQAYRVRTERVQKQALENTSKPLEILAVLTEDGGTICAYRIKEQATEHKPRQSIM